jgi:bifunctional DNA-binding transcriptional regulator/antitoxin component of YhaV-PrlF toxin-antitoxin module
MAQFKTRIDEDGSIVIPVELRQLMGLEIGDEMILHPQGKELCIFTTSQALKRAQELVSQYVPQDRSLADELIAERHSEAD